jgi:hypothetical protein
MKPVSRPRRPGTIISMIGHAPTDLAVCDGYRVFAEGGGELGRVEEIWLGAWDEATAVVVRLLDGRRGLLLAADVAGVWPETRFMTMAAKADLLRLEPPHVDPEHDGRRPAASWRTSGDVLELHESPRIGRLLPDALRASRGAAKEESERPLWQAVAGLFLTVLTIVVVLISLDFLVSYLVVGSPI